VKQSPSGADIRSECKFAAFRGIRRWTEEPTATSYLKSAELSPHPNTPFQISGPNSAVYIVPKNPSRTQALRNIRNMLTVLGQSAVTSPQNPLSWKTATTSRKHILWQGWPARLAKVAVFKSQRTQVSCSDSVKHFFLPYTLNQKIYCTEGRALEVCIALNPRHVSTLKGPLSKRHNNRQEKCIYNFKMHTITQR